MTIPTTRTSGRHPMLTAEQRQAVRQRWETSPKVGWTWIAREVEAAFGVSMSRAAYSNWAEVHGWAKRAGEFSAPLTPAPVAEQVDALDGTATPTPRTESGSTSTSTSGGSAEVRSMAVLARELTAHFDKPAVGPDRRPVLPTLERFALLRGTTVQELRAWGAQSAVFGRALALASERQRALLIEGAAAGIFSAELAAKVLQAQGRAYGQSAP